MENFKLSNYDMVGTKHEGKKIACISAIFRKELKERRLLSVG